MDWREYEDAVCDEFTMRYPKAEIARDIKLDGTLSGTRRQIDVLIDAVVAEEDVRTVVDAKMYNRRVDVKAVEEFLGLLIDVEADRGLMVTTIGYSKAALARAHRDSSHVELDVMSLAEFREFQWPLGIPFSRDRAAILPAPFGWVVDATVEGTVAVLYQRGLDFGEAAEAYEWAYVNFWHKDVPNTPNTLQGVLEKQDADLRKENEETELEHLDGVERKEPNIIRLAKRPNYPAWEYTGLIEFPEFLFFIVLFTLPEMSARNLRKVREALQWVKPGQIADERKDKSAPGVVRLHLGKAHGA